MDAEQTGVRLNRRNTSPLLLLVGSGLVFVTFMRFSLPEVAWVAFAPFLIFLHERAKIGRHLAVLGTLLVVFLLTVSKMVTAEIPWAPVPAFAIPIAVSYFVALVTASLAHRRLGASWGPYTFASTTTALGWIQYTFTPGSSWGVLAHTQLENLPLVQLAALTGVGGITFLVAFGSGLAAAVWSSGVKVVRKTSPHSACSWVQHSCLGNYGWTTPRPGDSCASAASSRPSRTRTSAERTSTSTLCASWTMSSSRALRVRPSSVRGSSCGPNSRR